MSTHLIQSETLTDIANAIRSKEGSSGTILTSDMASKIEGLKVGINETVLWTNSDPTVAFGTQTVTLKDRLDAFNFVKVTFYNSTSATATVNSYFLGSNSIWRLAYFPSSMSSRMFRYATVDDGYGTRRVTFGRGNNASGTNDSSCIPVQITGLKFVIEGGE